MGQEGLGWGVGCDAEEELLLESIRAGRDSTGRKKNQNENAKLVPLTCVICAFGMAEGEGGGGVDKGALCPLHVSHPLSLVALLSSCTLNQPVFHPENQAGATYRWGDRWEPKRETPLPPSPARAGQSGQSY